MVASGGGRESGPIYFTTHQVARLLGVSLPTVVNWHKSGRIKAHRTPGGHRRISRDELIRFANHFGYPLPEEFAGVEDGPRKVLVIDAERDFSEMVLEFLTIRDEYRVRTADGAFQAGYLLGAFQPDLVILGIGIPGLDPSAVRGMLKSDEDRAVVPVIACTSGPDPVLERQVQSGRLSAVLRKPVQLDALLELVRVALGATSS